MSKIWEPDRWYSFLRPYVDYCTRVSYSHLRVEGRLPEDGAVIIAPNHTNTLMDALVVLQSRKAPTVFGARADIFRKPAANRALRFLRILPMARERDGAQTIRDYAVSFDEVDDALAHGVPFCLFPEGRHHTDRCSLLPLKKGVNRIALRSAAERPTVIVPTGIQYGDFFRFRHACLVRYGKPLDVNAFLKEHEGETEQQVNKALTEVLSTRMLALLAPNPLPRKTAWWRYLLLPLWPAAALLSLPLWVPAEVVCRKIGDKAFCNSVRYLSKLLLTPLTFVIWALLLGFLLPWWLTLCCLALFLFSYSLFYDGLLMLCPKSKSLS